MFCPICSQATDTKAFVSNGYEPDKQFEIFHCDRCDAHFDSRLAAESEDSYLAAQASVNRDYYKPQFVAGELERALAVNSEMVRAFQRFFKSTRLHVEIGVGLGMLSRAAAGMFEASLGLDLEIETALSIGAVPPNLEFMTFKDFEQRDSLAASALCAWHVVEHLRDPRGVLGKLVACVEPGGVVYGQVPLFRPRYVCDAHYVFYSAQTLSYLFSGLGLEALYFEKDEVNDFLSFAFRK